MDEHSILAGNTDDVLGMSRKSPERECPECGHSEQYEELLYRRTRYTCLNENCGFVWEE